MNNHEVATETLAPDTEVQEQAVSPNPDPELARGAHIGRNSMRYEEECQRVDAHLGQVIDMLKANRGHIAGFAIVVMAKRGDAIYDPEDKDATDGITAQITADAPSATYIGHHLKNLAEMCQPSPSNPLAALMAGIGGKQR